MRLCRQCVMSDYRDTSCANGDQRMCMPIHRPLWTGFTTVPRIVGDQILAIKSSVNTTVVLPFRFDMTMWHIHPHYSLALLLAGQSTPAAPHTGPAAAKPQHEQPPTKTIRTTYTKLQISHQQVFVFAYLPYI